MSGSTYYSSLEEWAFRKRLMLAVVFTDVVGSTSLRKQLGDETMQSIVQQHFANARYYISQYNGYELKTIGDEVMAVFPTAVDALNYVLDLYENTGHDKIKIRAAIHVGTVSVVENENDISGTMVHLAARISKVARGAAIYVSDDAQIQITQVKSQRHVPLISRKRRVQLKDFEDVTHVWQVLTPEMRKAAIAENLKRRAADLNQPTTAPTRSVPARPVYVVPREEGPRRIPDPPALTTHPTIGETLSGFGSPRRIEPNSLAALLGTQATRSPGSTNLLAQFLAGTGENDGEKK